MHDGARSGDLINYKARGAKARLDAEATAEAINKQLSDSGESAVVAVAYHTYGDLFVALDELRSLVDKYAAANEIHEHNAKVYESILESATHLNSSARDPLIVVAGVNGPRPEHAHLDRDTPDAILRGMQKYGGYGGKQKP
jgi:hypothetical protein